MTCIVHHCIVGLLSCHAHVVVHGQVDRYIDGGQTEEGQTYRQASAFPRRQTTAPSIHLCCSSCDKALHCMDALHRCFLNVTKSC